ncbi:MAG: hypothetical protein HKN03_17365 [Acidimicrobiales bacterium]|nr:hypothetical protein [Acidimicrobiales bacterium]
MLGVKPDKDGVRLGNGRLKASFGFLNVDTAIENVSSASVTGPYTWWKAIGPRLSMADHGLTFGTTADGGVCVKFVKPIKGVVGPWDHPGLTLTVDDPAGLVEAIENAKQ